jgi:hypothetical protein
MAAGAAAAAAARRRKNRREEEEMTAYRSDDLDGWEFKILRSSIGAFRNPNTMAAVLADEARFGWELVEKFDNERLRLKRPISARAKDSGFNPGADPYRTQYGMSEGMLGVSIFVVIMLGMGIALGAIYLFTS